MTVSTKNRNRSMERHGTCVLLFRPGVDQVANVSRASSVTNRLP
jgi:hypothetical protein